MAGGTFLVQNKVRPGVYINFNSVYKAVGTIGERGKVLLPISLPFGPCGKAVEVTADSDVVALFGLKSDSEELLLLREAAKRAKTVLVWRLNGGEKAGCTAENMTITAKYAGSLGNRISVQVTEGQVKVFLNGEEAADDLVEISGELSNGSFVLQGGSDGEEDWEGFFKAALTLEFNTMAIPCEETAVKEAAVACIRRMREDEGIKVQAVVAQMDADYEGIISVENGVVLQGGRELSAAETTAYAAGMTAGSEVNQSNTYGVYEGAVDVTEHYTNSQVEALLKMGRMVFLKKGSKVVIEQDINSFVSVTGDKGRAFQKNRLIRVLDQIGNDVKEIFTTAYIGKVHNNMDGRRLLQAELLRYLQNLEQIGAVANVQTEDIVVTSGENADSVVVALLVQPVDSMEKLYMTVTAE